MRRATDIRRAGSWTPGRGCPTVTLGHEDRQRRRLRLRDDSGEPFLLDLEAAPRLVEGDGLVLADGGTVMVVAAPEPVIDIACESATQTARVAWHLGNRHAPLQVLADGRLRIRDDHVLATMVQGLGASTVRRAAPFTPESGAYAVPGGDPSQPAGA